MNHSFPIAVTAPPPSPPSKEVDPVMIARVEATLIDNRQHLLDLIFEGHLHDQLSWRVDFPLTQTRKEYEAKHGKFSEGDLCPALDEKWERYLDTGSGHDLLSMCWEDITSEWTGRRHGETWWTDQTMENNGTTVSFDWCRSGDYIMLKYIDGLSTDRGDLEDDDFCSLDLLRDLYVTCARANQVFDSESVEADFNYRLMFERAKWEEELRDET